MSWILILSLLFVEQKVGTPVRLETQRVTDIATYKMCEDGGKAFLKSHGLKATEPSDDYEGEGVQPTADQFELMRPIYTCIQVR